MLSINYEQPTHIASDVFRHNELMQLVHGTHVGLLPTDDGLQDSQHAPYRRLTCNNNNSR